MLSEEEVFNIYCTSDSVIDTHITNLYRFARAIEAEVRAQDEVLIRQLVNALEPFAYEKPAREAIAAARARLEDAK